MALKTDKTESSVESKIWKEGYAAAMRKAARGVRELYCNYVHMYGADGLLKRCEELEQVFIKEGEQT